jgi:hypothetical protein
MVSFYITGVINRGDSFRRRRSRSASLIPPSSPLRVPEKVLPIHNGPDDSFLVAMLGGQGVGKASLSSQFKTSECINAYDGGGRGRCLICILKQTFIFIKILYHTEAYTRESHNINVYKI